MYNVRNVRQISGFLNVSRESFFNIILILEEFNKI